MGVQERGVNDPGVYEAQRVKVIFKRVPHCAHHAAAAAALPLAPPLHAIQKVCHGVLRLLKASCGALQHCWGDAAVAREIVSHGEFGLHHSVVEPALTSSS